MRNSNIVAAIDIGTSNIVGAIAEVSDTGDIKLLAYSQTMSKGIKKGGITNIIMLQHAIDEVLDNLQSDCDCQILSMVASISGASMIGYNIEGAVDLYGSQVEKQHLSDSIYNAKQNAMIEENKILHALTQSFTIDQQDGIDNPIGLMGETLSAHLHIISVAKTAYYNLIQIFSHRSVAIEKIVAANYASSLAVTKDDEKEAGICVLDIGSGTIDMTIIKNDVVRHTATVDMGASSITSDMAFFMRSTMEDAESIKTKLCIDSAYSYDEVFHIKGTSQTREYSKRDIAHVARERCEYLVETILDKITQAGAQNLFPKGFVLCGGGANQKGFDKLLADRSNIPVRIAKVEVEIAGQTNLSSDLATIMGIFLCAYQEDDLEDTHIDIVNTFFKRLKEKARVIKSRIAKQF